MKLQSTITAAQHSRTMSEATELVTLWTRKTVADSAHTFITLMGVVLSTVQALCVI